MADESKSGGGSGSGSGSGGGGAPRFEVKKWNAVALWQWGAYTTLHQPAPACTTLHHTHHRMGAARAGQGSRGVWAVGGVWCVVCSVGCLG